MRISLATVAATVRQRALPVARRLGFSVLRVASQVKSSWDSLPASLSRRIGRSAAGITILSVLLIALWSQNLESTFLLQAGENSSSGGGHQQATELWPVSALGNFLQLKPEYSGPGPSPTAAPDDGRATAVPPSSRSARPYVGDRPMTMQESFIASAVGPAQASQRETKVPASVTIAQAILESDWGRSGLTKDANNYFGIKARPDPGPAGIVYKATREVINGASVILNEPFRAYHSMEESFIDHGKFLAERPFYANAFKYVDDAKQFAREIQKGGYATDPNYANSLIRLMDQYNLYAYDLK